MNKSKFCSWYYAMGLASAIEAAKFFGVPQSQIDLWCRTIYKPAHWRN